MKFELQHVQAQIDAVNNGEEISLEAAAVAGTIEANVGQLARKAITAEGKLTAPTLAFSVVCSLG